MSLSGNGLTFQPLFWSHHDSWVYYKGDGGPEDLPAYHWGHQHLFIPGWNFNSGSQDAWGGQQKFSYNIVDIWGPRSGDANQQSQYRVIGTPKWYWTIDEVWRRFYIQPWDKHIDIGDPTNTKAVGRQGIRWDASKAEHTMGPFREGARFSPYFIPAGGRTLPLEYYTSDANMDQSHRENYVQGLALAMMTTWNSQAINSQVPRTWGVSPPTDFIATNMEFPHIRGTHINNYTYPDALYQMPLIEYRMVRQLNNERFPTWQEEHDIDANNFGDGWNNVMMVPYISPYTLKYNSPFSPVPGQVSPIGQYYGVDTSNNPLVDPTTYPVYRAREDAPPEPDLPFPPGPQPGGYDYVNEPYGLPAFTKNDPRYRPIPGVWNDGAPVNDDFRPQVGGTVIKQWQNPHGVTDGMWVQQCLGGLVTVNAVVTIESKLGGRQDVTISNTQLIQAANFAGSDQADYSDLIVPQSINMPKVGRFVPGQMSKPDLEGQ
jgi:hypothetical protein